MKETSCPKCGNADVQKNNYSRAIRYFGVDYYCSKCHIHINSSTGKTYNSDDVEKKFWEENPETPEDSDPEQHTGNYDDKDC